MAVDGTQAVWIPPPKGTVKLNFDGGLSRHRGCAVAGGIFRDHQGVPLFSYTCADPTLVGFTPYDGEARALALGLVFARNLGFTSLWVEGDAQYLIDVVPGRRPNTWYDENTVGFIRSVMDKFPREPVLSWVPREANSAADALVRHMRADVSAVVEEKWDRGARLPASVAAVVDRERNGYAYARRRTCCVPGALFSAIMELDPLSTAVETMDHGCQPHREHGFSLYIDQVTSSFSDHPNDNIIAFHVN